MITETGRRNAVKVLFVDDEFIEFRALKKKIADLSEPAVEVEYSPSIGDALEKIRLARFDLILLDNRLLPNADFRETVPELRGIGYTGPIGVVSTDISGGYFRNSRITASISALARTKSMPRRCSTSSANM